MDKYTDSEVEDSDCDIESFLATGDLCQRVMSIAEGLLSELEYAVFRLEFEGYTTKDIALKLGKTPKSVDNAKARIAKRLRTSNEIRSILTED
jgi:DNA-binding NarL/FixJ family response regulator